jgi:hypothetical protein
LNKLQSFRKEKDAFFAGHPQSPLTHEQKHNFNGLNYFAENPELIFEVKVEEFAEKEPINIQTSTGDVLTYDRFGRFRFTVDGQSAELTLYSRDEDFFLPFTDALSGKETYGAGRYLEPIALGKGKFLIDFNYAYNPYCAYNAHWSCPLTPSENRLKVAIRAGEKVFEAH